MKLIIWLAVVIVGVLAIEALGFTGLLGGILALVWLLVAGELVNGRRPSGPVKPTAPDESAGDEWS